jgi:hypothetical protein
MAKVISPLVGARAVFPGFMVELLKRQGKEDERKQKGR